MKEQQLSNLMHSKKFTKALRLAITLDQPFKALGIIKTILEESDGETQLAITITKLRPDQIESILRFAQTWNMNSKHCHVAQCVVGIVLRSQDPEDLVKFPGMKDILEGLLPYTERHFTRLSKMLQQAMFVQYTWQVMRRASGLQELTDEQHASTSDSAKGMEDFFLDKIGDVAHDESSDDEDDDGEDDDDEDKDFEEEDDADMDVDEEVSRTSKRKILEQPKSKPLESQETNDDDDDEEEEEEEKEQQKKALPSKRTSSVKGVVSQQHDEDDDEEGNASEMEDEEEKENKSRPTRKSGKKEQKSRTSISMKKVQKRTLSKDHHGDNNEEEEEIPSPVKRQTRQVPKDKVSATPGRGSKRKSTLKPVETLGKSPKKSTPSPYNKKLRRQSRK